MEINEALEAVVGLTKRVRSVAGEKRYGQPRGTTIGPTDWVKHVVRNVQSPLDRVLAAHGTRDMRSIEVQQPEEQEIPFRFNVPPRPPGGSPMALEGWDDEGDEYRNVLAPHVAAIGVELQGRRAQRQTASTIRLVPNETNKNNLISNVDSIIRNMFAYRGIALNQQKQTEIQELSRSLTDGFYVGVLINGMSAGDALTALVQRLTRARDLQSSTFHMDEVSRALNA